MIRYVIPLVSIIIFGDTALMAVIYLSISGKLELAVAFTLGLIATLIADSSWYFIGSRFPTGKFLRALKIPRFDEKYPELVGAFNRNSLKILFYSKFLLGLRTPVRAFYGAQGLPLKPFLAINLASATVWMIVIALLSSTLKISLSGLENLLQEVLLALSIIILLTIVIYKLTEKRLKDKLSNI
jgi:membrane protein DedA with SNARE-associated domain